jgi:site-specific DNA recombinase
MSNTAKRHTCIEPVRRLAVIYARVSSKEQEKEGYSIAAQLKLLNEYSTAQGFTIAQEYVDVETAKHSGRIAFGEMVSLLRKKASARILLVEKTDRLYRNLKDWVTLDELDLEIHLVKEGVILSRESRSSEKFMHGIKVLMAKNYIDNLSEEARKGMLEKAEQGVWPTKAPLGYRNVVGADGKRIIEPDPQVAPIVIRLFEWYAPGRISLKQAAKMAAEAGLKYRRSGGVVPTSTVHKILRNRLYMGEFEWKGRVYRGRHLPLVTRQLWERVEAVLDARQAKKLRHSKHDFAFSGLIACGHCGCALVGEIKKARYVYYHCTGYKGKCPEPYVREELLEDRFSALLGRLSFDKQVLEWAQDALRLSHADEVREHKTAIARHQDEYDRLQNRIHAMYIDKLDGRVDAAFFDRTSALWRAEQQQCLRAIERHQRADQSYLDEGIRVLELAQNARRLFEQREAHEKRRLLDFVVSNCGWKGGELFVNFRQPFDLIAETAERATRATVSESQSEVKREIWLGDKDSNLD